MKYYLKPHVTDEMLKAVGFKIVSNSWGYKWAIRNPSQVDSISINLDNISDDKMLIVGFPYERDVTSLIQDLIDLGYVEVRN